MPIVLIGLNHKFQPNQTELKSSYTKSKNEKNFIKDNFVGIMLLGNIIILFVGWIAFTSYSTTKLDDSKNVLQPSEVTTKNIDATSKNPLIHKDTSVQASERIQDSQRVQENQRAQESMSLQKSVQIVDTIDLNGIDLIKISSHVRAIESHARKCVFNAQVYNKANKNCIKARELIVIIQPDIESLAKKLENKSLDSLNYNDKLKIIEISNGLSNATEDLQTVNLLVN